MGSLVWKNIPLQEANTSADVESLPPNKALGVPEGASLTEIKAAYRRKMLAYHPDRTGEFLRQHNGRIARIINRAYRQLTGGQP
jgi:curved DNA-binding protein CbpA